MHFVLLDANGKELGRIVHEAQDQELSATLFSERGIPALIKDPTPPPPPEKMN